MYSTTAHMYRSPKLQYICLNHLWEIKLLVVLWVKKQLWCWTECLVVDQNQARSISNMQGCSRSRESWNAGCSHRREMQMQKVPTRDEACGMRNVHRKNEMLEATLRNAVWEVSTTQWNKARPLSLAVALVWSYCESVMQNGVGTAGIYIFFEPTKQLKCKESFQTLREG